MPEQTARNLIAAADQHRATAEGAEWARNKIRLWERPVVRKGLLGFRRKSEAHRELEFTAAETAAIYEALRIVRDDANRKADDLDCRVTTTTPAHHGTPASEGGGEA